LSLTGSPRGRSKRRTPSPTRTGATCTMISSRSPASTHCRATFAPRTTRSSSPGRLLGGPDRLFDADIQESATDALHDRGLRGRVVPQDKERPAKGTSVEPRLQPVLNVLRPPTDQQRSRRAHHLVHRLAFSTADPEDPSHVVIWTCDEAIKAHHCVPEDFAHSHAPFRIVYFIVDRDHDRT
jgi:hypothetical protein